MMISDNTHMLSGSLKRITTSSHLFLSMSSAELHSNSGLALRHHGVAETNHKDILVKHAIRHFSCYSCIAKPNRSNGTLVMA